MNILAYSLLALGIYIGVSKGSDSPDELNKHDERAVGIVIAATIFALIDIVMTVVGYLSGG